MKVIKLSFKGFNDIPSFCYAKIRDIEDLTVVVLIHGGKKSGTSITNYFEGIATMVFHEVLSTDASADKTIWYDCWGEDTYGFKRSCRTVLLTFNKNVFSSPVWAVPLNLEESKIKKINQLLDEIEQNEKYFPDNIEKVIELPNKPSFYLDNTKDICNKDNKTSLMSSFFNYIKNSFNK